MTDKELGEVLEQAAAERHDDVSPGAPPPATTSTTAGSPRAGGSGTEPRTPPPLPPDHLARSALFVGLATRHLRRVDSFLQSAIAYLTSDYPPETRPTAHAALWRRAQELCLEPICTHPAFGPQTERASQVPPEPDPRSGDTPASAPTKPRAHAVGPTAAELKRLVADFLARPGASVADLIDPTAESLKAVARAYGDSEHGAGVWDTASVMFTFGPTAATETLIVRPRASSEG